MLAIAKNPLDYTPRQLDTFYKKKSLPSYTQTQVSNHLKSLKNKDAISHTILPDIDSFRSPLTQNLIDIWHQSNLSWNDFRDSSNVLTNLSKEDNINTANTILNGYHTQFTRNIYAPLQSYISTEQPYVLKDDSNLLLQQISELHNQVITKKWRTMSPNHCMQIDIRSQNPLQINPYLEDDDDYYPSLYFKPRFATNEKKYKGGLTDLVSKVRECISFNHNYNTYCYKRYEILLYGDEYQIFKAKCNNTIPNCAHQHPLPKIYNATQNILPNDQLNANDPGLITFSFLVNHDCIRMYLIFADGTKQLYGTRIFTNDLESVVPKLFENKKLSTLTQLELATLQPVPDTTFNEYCKRLGVDTLMNDAVAAIEEQKTEETQVGIDIEAEDEAEYNPYDDTELFEGLLDQTNLYQDESLFYQQETNNYLSYQLERAQELNNELINMVEEYGMDNTQINQFNNKQIESGLELPSDIEW